MPFITVAILLLGLFGHAAFWVAVNNRFHATAFDRRIVNALEKVFGLLVIGVPILALQRLRPAFDPSQESFPGIHAILVRGWGPIWTPYLAAGSLFAVWVLVAWIKRQRIGTRSPLLTAWSESRCRVAEKVNENLVGDWKTWALARLPGNQALELSEAVKDVGLPNWPPSLSGLTIAHLSDLHFTGGIRQAFFDFVVERANASAPDLIVITGDIVDAPACLPWIESSLGKLRARHGVFAILGNHDRRKVNPLQVRSALKQGRIMDIGGTFRTLDLRGGPLLLAGNERPWFDPAPDLEAAPLPFSRGGPPRLLLSHSPDQIDWARRHEFQLMLAGHTHGGQIRIPVIGPIVAPSHYGVKYASGMFYEPPTLLHVSRGIAGLDPLRWNCLPELAILRISATKTT